MNTTRASLLIRIKDPNANEAWSEIHDLYAPLIYGYARRQGLSRDDAEVDKYIDDPYCGAISTAGFFYDMLTGMGAIFKDINIRKVPKDLPIHLFSGDKDPVAGKNCIGVLQAREDYQKAGVKDVSMKLYENGRHEMVNEINKHEVYRDVIDWCDAHVR